MPLRARAARQPQKGRRTAAQYFLQNSTRSQPNRRSHLRPISLPAQRSSSDLRSLVHRRRTPRRMCPPLASPRRHVPHRRDPQTGRQHSRPPPCLALPERMRGLRRAPRPRPRSPQRRQRSRSRPSSGLLELTTPHLQQRAQVAVPSATKTAEQRREHPRCSGRRGMRHPLRRKRSHQSRLRPARQPRTRRACLGNQRTPLRLRRQHARS